MPDLEELAALAGKLKMLIDDRPSWIRQRVYSQGEGRDEADIDSRTLYYRFLWEYSKKYRPARILEIGTYVGTSAIHLACPNPEGRVITVDINGDAARQVKDLNVPNIKAVTSDSMNYFKSGGDGKLFDLVYIDGNHCFNQTYGEYVAFRQWVVPNGLIFVDDLALDMEGDEMGVFWHFVVDQKKRLDFLHHTGFGIIKATSARPPQSWSDVISVAARMMEENKCGKKP